MGFEHLQGGVQFSWVCKHFKHVSLLSRAFKLSLTSPTCPFLVFSIFPLHPLAVPILSFESLQSSKDPENSRPIHLLQRAPSHTVYRACKMNTITIVSSTSDDSDLEIVAKSFPDATESVPIAEKSSSDPVNPSLKTSKKRALASERPWECRTTQRTIRWNSVLPVEPLAVDIEFQQYSKGSKNSRRHGYQHHPGGHLRRLSILQEQGRGHPELRTTGAGCRGSGLAVTERRSGCSKDGSGVEEPDEGSTDIRNPWAQCSGKKRLQYHV